MGAQYTKLERWDDLDLEESQEGSKIGPKRSGLKRFAKLTMFLNLISLAILIVLFIHLSSITRSLEFALNSRRVDHPHVHLFHHDSTQEDATGSGMDIPPELKKMPALIDHVSKMVKQHPVMVHF